jgi:hypothetical protein
VAITGGDVGVESACFLSRRETWVELCARPLGLEIFCDFIPAVISTDECPRSCEAERLNLSSNELEPAPWIVPLSLQSLKRLDGSNYAVAPSIIRSQTFAGWVTGGFL